ncbi:MAG: hypothetical protein KOO65_06270, partial [Desulfobacterales bacterium]|nr:hypothetical protein [Desulfobacterales bacterium]
MVNNQFSILYKKNIIILLCSTISIIISSGCSLYKTRNMVTNHPKLKTVINKSITNLYPDRFKAIHHVILTLSGKDYVLDGYLFIDRANREIKLIAQNDLGGIIFEIHYIKNIKKTISINTNTLKKNWLEKSVLRDLEMLYLKEPFPSPTLFYDQQENLVLSQKEGRITRELLYKQINSQAKYRLKEIRHMANEKCFYTISLKYGTVSDNPYPEFILIKDTKM